MACAGGGQGVLAVMELEKISEEVKGLMAEIDKDLEVSIDDINSIKENLKKISDQNKSQ